jgi:hypothetical protein
MAKIRSSARTLDANDRRMVARGSDLACYCPLDEPCHADVLLGVANE